MQAIPDLTAAGVVVVGLLAARSPRWFDRVTLAAAALAGAAVWGEVTWWSLDR